MAQIIEILSGQYFNGSYGGNTGAKIDNNYFLSDNTATDVPIITVNDKWYFVFTQIVANGRKWFKPNDNVRILSVGVNLPYHFTHGNFSYHMGMDLFYTTEGASSWEPIAQLGDTTIDRMIPLNGFNYEMSLDLFVPHGYNNNKCFGCYVQGRVSMIGCPDSLNNTRFWPIPFMKVMHNLSLLEDTP